MARSIAMQGAYTACKASFYSIFVRVLCLVEQQAQNLFNQLLCIVKIYGERILLDIFMFSSL